MELPPYGTRLWQQAVSETRNYWNANRTWTVISGPFGTLCVWSLFRGWRGWMEALYAILAGIGIFGFGWGIVFFISLIKAPGQLDAKWQEATRKHVPQAKPPIVEHRDAQVRRWLIDFTDEEKNFLGWLLDKGPANRQMLVHCGIDEKARNGAIQKGRGFGFIVDDRDIREPMMSIHPNYVEPLTNALHPPTSN